MEEPHIIVSHESSIMVSGEAPRQARGFLWAGIVAGIIGLFGLGFLLFFILQTIPLPRNTFFLTSVRPSGVSLAPESEARLPEEWRAALETRSRWPVILGASFENGRFQTFSLVPAWVSSDRIPETTVAVFVRLLAMNPTAISAEQTRYVTFLRRIMVLDFQPWKQGLGKVTFLPEKSGVWRSDTGTSLTVPVATHAWAFSDAHFPLSFARVTDAGLFSVGEGLMKAMVQFSDQVDVFLPRASSTVTGYVFSAQEGWTEEQLGQILPKLGVVGRVSRELPDGSSANFLLPPNVASTTLPFTVRHPSLGDVTLAKDTLWLNVATTTETTALKPACEGFVPMARLSPKMVQLVARNILGQEVPFSLPGIQVGVDKQRLLVCVE